MGDKTTKINRKTPLKKTKLAKTFDYEGKLDIPNPYDKGKFGVKGNVKRMNAETRKKYEKVKDLLRVLDLEADLGKQEKFDKGGSKSSKNIKKSGTNEEYQKIFDDMMGNPLSKIDKLIKQAKELNKPKKRFNQGGSNMGKKKMKNGGGIKEAISNFFGSGTKPVLEPGKGARPKGSPEPTVFKSKKNKKPDANKKTDNPFKAKNKSNAKVGQKFGFEKVKTKNSTTKNKVFPNTKGKDYTIKKNDTLSGIAKSQGTTVAAIMAANKGIKNPNNIRAGAGLVIPGGGKTKVKSNTKTNKTNKKSNVPTIFKKKNDNKSPLSKFTKPVVVKSRKFGDESKITKNTDMSKTKVISTQNKKKNNKIKNITVTPKKKNNKIKDQTFITNRKKGGAKVKMNRGGTFKGIF
mgnify:CR=1 FL=1